MGINMSNLKVRLLQALLFVLGAYFIFERTMRVAAQVPEWEVMLNITEVVLGFFLITAALELPRLVHQPDGK